MPGKGGTNRASVLILAVLTCGCALLVGLEKKDLPGLDALTEIDAPDYDGDAWDVPPGDIPGEEFDFSDGMVCIPEQIQCTDDRHFDLCREDGSGWHRGLACPDGTSCVDDGCYTPCQVSERSRSPSGCLFFAADLDIIEDMDLDLCPFSISVVNPDGTGSATVSIERKSEGRWSAVQNHVVAPGDFYTFVLPSDTHVEDTGIARESAYRISSNLPILAYQYNSLDTSMEGCAASADGSLLIPFHLFATEYVVASYKTLSLESMHGRSYFSVIGTEDTTVLSIEVTADTIEGPGIMELVAGATFSTSINEGDVLQIAARSTDDDLTGTIVSSSASVAVFGGSECSAVPQHCAWCRDAYDTQPGYPPCPDSLECGVDVTCPTFDENTCAWCDHLEEQLFPVNTWGKKFAAARVPVQSSADLIEGVLFRVIASEDDTQVIIAEDDGADLRLPPESIMTLDRGEFLEFELSGMALAPGDAYIETTRPVMVAQYIEGQECTNIPYSLEDEGLDPSMILLPPMEQYVSEYVFFVPDGFFTSYVIITRPPGATVMLDGSPVEDFLQVGTYFEVARAPVVPGVHHIQGSEPFGILGAGFGPQVSYGIPLGSGFDLINPP